MTCKEVAAMDDSEKSYGYSEDIYHGQRAEKSYEYGPEDEDAGSELAPEEEAIHIEGADGEEAAPRSEAPEYDYGREGNVETESFTWENPQTDEVTAKRENRS
jgi:hypothetical protein